MSSVETIDIYGRESAYSWLSDNRVGMISRPVPINPDNLRLIEPMKR
jgi:hypothetical protein